MGYDNTNSGIIFVQTEKKTEKSPDFSGSLNVDGKEYWVSGWKKYTQKGEGISMALKPKDAATPKPVPVGAGAYDDSDIPFGPMID